MTVKRSLVLSTPAFQPMIEVAKAAESAGISRLWTTESPGRDAIVRAVTLGQHTSSIGIGTGIAYAFTRAPLAMAAAAADAHIATQGRFAIGLGAGTRGLRSRRYGVDTFDHPAPRLGDYIGLMRAAWAAEDGLSYEGSFFTAEVPGRVRSSELDEFPRIEVHGSGLNATMLRYAAKDCDGVALHPLASYADYLDRVAMPAIHAGSNARETPPSVAAWRITSVAEDEDVARWQARVNLAFYFTTPSYQSITAGTRWAEHTIAVRDLYPTTPSFETLAHSLPDEMIDDFCLAGTPEQVRAKAVEVETAMGERGIHELVFQVAGVGLDSAGYVEAANTVIDALGRPRG